MINYGKQLIKHDDIEDVVSVLKSDFLTQGPQVPSFEAEFASFVGSKFGVASNSATSALHIACLALGLKEGDILWTVPNSFVASANCGLYCGAQVDFVDIDPQTLNMSVEALDKKLNQAERINKLPKVIVPVHFSGSPCDMQNIKSLVEDYNIRIIEDASHAVGSEYKQEKIGRCAYSDISVFSFHPVKIITTGEGGLATTNDENLFRRMQKFRSHGITRDIAKVSKHCSEPWYYEQHYLGYNYRLTDIQAALGRSQLKKTDKFISLRQKIAERYLDAFSQIDIALPYVDPQSRSSWHLFPIQLNAEKYVNRKIEIFHRFKENGIGLNVHYIPIHTQPYFQKLGFKKGDFPFSEQYYKRAFSLPIYPSMTDREQYHVISTCQKLLT